MRRFGCVFTFDGAGVWSKRSVIASCSNGSNGQRSEVSFIIYT